VGELVLPASVRLIERRTLLIGSPLITIEAPPLFNIENGTGLEAPDGINETLDAKPCVEETTIVEGNFANARTFQSGRCRCRRGGINP
jgi:hypothetical protein